MRYESENDWWELRVNGKLITTVAGRDRAEWFLEKMKVVDLDGKWELISAYDRPWSKPITPEETSKNIKTQYCTGSD